ncbi:MAG: type II secretion system GspH family protein [Kiritimatiellae bacterium]|nr:type II secretion system GspH family protein [Kiritimatiellia bacterium]
MKSTEKGFTLVELIVVIGIIALLMAALTVSLSESRKRAQISKAQSEVRIVSQAILGTEAFRKNEGLDSLVGENQEADYSRLREILGDGGQSDSGEKIPATLMAQLQSGNRMMDPWNRPYRITVRKGSASVKLSTSMSSLQTGFYFPNYYRLAPEERQ